MQGEGWPPARVFTPTPSNRHRWRTQCSAANRAGASIFRSGCANIAHQDTGLEPHLSSGRLTRHEHQDYNGILTRVRSDQIEPNMPRPTPPSNSKSRTAPPEARLRWRMQRTHQRTGPASHAMTPMPEPADPSSQLRASQLTLELGRLDNLDICGSARKGKIR